MRFVTALVIMLLVLVPGVGSACVGSPFGEGPSCASAGDEHEPNDGLQQATSLVPGDTLQASIERGGPRGDVDIFASDSELSGGLTSFRVEIRSDRARDIEVRVGASIPGVFEAISWPGWRPRRSGDLIVVEGSLEKGTVLIFVSASRRAEYTVSIDWVG